MFPFLSIFLPTFVSVFPHTVGQVRLLLLLRMAFFGEAIGYFSCWCCCCFCWIATNVRPLVPPNQTISSWFFFHFLFFLISYPHFTSLFSFCRLSRGSKLSNKLDSLLFLFLKVASASFPSLSFLPNFGCIVFSCSGAHCHRRMYVLTAVFPFFWLLPSPFSKTLFLASIFFERLEIKLLLLQLQLITIYIFFLFSNNVFISFFLSFFSDDCRRLALLCNSNNNHNNFAAAFVVVVWGRIGLNFSFLANNNIAVQKI